MMVVNVNIFDAVGPEDAASFRERVCSIKPNHKSGIYGDSENPRQMCIWMGSVDRSSGFNLMSFLLALISSIC